MEYRRLQINCLCHTCMGCNRLEDSDFRGSFDCCSYIADVSIPMKEPLFYYYQFPRRRKPNPLKLKRKNIIMEFKNGEEGLKFLRDLKKKQYYISTVDGDIDGLGTIIAVFHCYNDRSDEYGSSCEIRTDDAKLKNELLNLFRGE